MEHRFYRSFQRLTFSFTITFLPIAMPKMPAINIKIKHDRNVVSRQVSLSSKQSL